MPKIDLETRDLYALGNLLKDRLKTIVPATARDHEKRALVRLALIVDHAGRPLHRSLAVLDGAPTWVYAYLGGRIVDFAAPPAPKARPRAARRRPRA